jgi:hypothetical protein
VVVSAADTKDANVKAAEMGKFDLPMDKIKNLPVIFGEQDILKTIQLLPGVQSGTEGSTGFYVRGGGADQNLILLDEATVYNSSHLWFFPCSTAMPFSMRHSTRRNAGSVRRKNFLRLDISEEEIINLSGSGGIDDCFTTHAQGPIIKDKCSFIVSGRRTYITYHQAFISKILRFTEAGIISMT